MPALSDELNQRMAQPGTAFLDVGTGVAALAIAMCRLWPSLQVVGIDPSEHALALAREQVAAADASGQVELRQASIEDLAYAERSSRMGPDVLCLRRRPRARDRASTYGATAWRMGDSRHIRPSRYPVH
jgi:SAM-dependent methyltransferase